MNCILIGELSACWESVLRDNYILSNHRDKFKQIQTLMFFTELFEFTFLNISILDSLQLFYTVIDHLAGTHSSWFLLYRVDPRVISSVA